MTWGLAIHLAVQLGFIAVFLDEVRLLIVIILVGVIVVHDRFVGWFVERLDGILLCAVSSVEYVVAHERGVDEAIVALSVCVRVKLLVDHLWRIIIITDLLLNGLIIIYIDTLLMRCIYRMVYKYWLLYKYN